MLFRELKDGRGLGSIIKFIEDNYLRLGSMRSLQMTPTNWCTNELHDQNNLGNGDFLEK